MTQKGDTEKGFNYNLKDLSLKDYGREKIYWAEQFMQVLMHYRNKYKNEKPLKGYTIGMAIHLEAKTAVLAKTFHELGANVAITGCNPLTVQDDVAAACTDFAHVYAFRGISVDEYYENIDLVLSHEPDLVVDDGGDMGWRIVEKHSHLLEKLIGLSEETTTGINRFRNMEKSGTLKFPVMATNDAMMKHLFDNRYGTGESSLFGILNATNLNMAGKKVVVAGYGMVGRGIALRARGLGARVTITEVDPIKAVEAYHEGYEVKPMLEAIKDADIVITATGVNKIVSEDHFKVAKNKLIACNAGHFNVEIDVDWLNNNSVEQKQLRYFGHPYNQHMITEYVLKDGKKIYVISEGRLVNLAAGQGHATEIMDLSFSIQLEAMLYLVKNKKQLENKVYLLPREIDENVARMKLESLGIKIDQLSLEQEEYIKRADLGT